MASHQEHAQRWVDHRTGKTDRPILKRSRRGNVFGDGDALYSYGYHFELAIHLDWGFLCNGDRYSPSTGKHQSILRSVLDGNPTWKERAEGIETKDSHKRV